MQAGEIAISDLYLKHFGMREFPFSITPDTSFFFSSSAAEEALNTLLIAVNTGEGFIKITGQPGTGKTLLCRKLMASLREDCRVAYIPNPYLEPLAMFRVLASDLEVDLPSEHTLDQHDLLNALMLRLLDIVRSGQRVVICLDEAQAMPIETLEALRLLTNLETEKRKLLQVIIFGQPELDEKLDQPSVRQLKQRITFDCRLEPLSGNEIDYYVHHRLVVAGYQGGPLFTQPALWLMRLRTNRVPRLLNIISHKAMLRAFGKGSITVGLFDVLAAANDTGSLRWNRREQMLGLLLAAVILFSSLGWVYLP